MRLYCLVLSMLLTTHISKVEADDTLHETATNLFDAIQAPDNVMLNSPRVILGQRLFWDKRISANGEVSCASCHKAQEWSSDARAYSVDARNERTSRHSQPIFNAVGQVGLRWLADRPNAERQAQGSLTGSLGFDSQDEAFSKLRKLGYEALFNEAFPDSPTSLTAENYGKAIAAYELTLTTPSAFDRYLQGDINALTATQRNGLDIFISTGCAACHNGARLGGETVQKFGLFGNYWQHTGSAAIDDGLFTKTGKAADKYVFRVPMLRNIAKTAPYFHDGSVNDLHEAVSIMAKIQLDKSLSEDEVAAIISFLNSLTGEVPKNYTSPF